MAQTRASMNPNQANRTRNADSPRGPHPSWMGGLSLGDARRSLSADEFWHRVDS
jgi:hypothetical protein